MFHRIARAFAATILCMAILSIVHNPAAQAAEKLTNSKIKLRLLPVGTGFARPVWAGFAPKDNQRLFVLEQFTGKVYIQNLKTKKRFKKPFIQIKNLSRKNEQGLLGMAFHPNYPRNGFFYLNYTRPNGDTVIARYRANPANPNKANPRSEKIIMIIHQPQWNHNGGWMSFGPDGFLYIAMGDGGAGFDTDKGHTPKIGNGQDLTNNLLAKMLRIDVNKDEFKKNKNKNYSIPASNPFVKNKKGDPEIWAYGLRNVWRASFDKKTGDLYMGDVGQGQFEEINIQSQQSKGGENYGWKLREGFVKTNKNVGGKKKKNMTDPVYAYASGFAKGQGKSVIGGYVYRGKAIPQLEGHYFFADYVSKGIWSFKYHSKIRSISHLTDWSDAIADSDGWKITNPASFAQDHQGEIYIVNHAGGIYKLVPSNQPREKVK